MAMLRIKYEIIFSISVMTAEMAYQLTKMAAGGVIFAGVTMKMAKKIWPCRSVMLMKKAGGVNLAENIMKVISQP
jgi:hypothetical protein